MRNKSLKIDILADELRSLLSLPEIDGEAITQQIKKEFPNFSIEDSKKIAMLVEALINNKANEKTEIVATTPVSFKTNNRKTYPVIEELISSAQKNIILTGYSISDHFDEMLDLINTKSKQGVLVELFVNDYEQIKVHMQKIEHANRNFFRVYRYSGIEGDKMAALHAKTMIVDETKMLISSANLSYHGMVSNIEIGVLIESRLKCIQVINIFSELKKMKMFKIHQ